MKQVKINDKTHRLLMLEKVKRGFKTLSDTIEYLIREVVK